MRLILGSGSWMLIRECAILKSSTAVYLAQYRCLWWFLYYDMACITPNQPDFLSPPSQASLPEEQFSYPFRTRHAFLPLPPFDQVRPPLRDPGWRVHGRTYPAVPALTPTCPTCCTRVLNHTACQPATLLFLKLDVCFKYSKHTAISCFYKHIHNGCCIPSRWHVLRHGEEELC
jgi:hypothetical protein